MNDSVPDLHSDSLPLLAMSDLPYLTANLPGIGGRWKDVAEDFVVEEIPAYEPGGSGEHLFLWIEKKNVSAKDLVHHVSRALRCSPRDIGVAGLKDRRAITRQYISVPAKLAADVPQIESDSIRVLRSAQHGNKLRTGHLRGNRFTILIRDVDASATERAAAIADRIFPITTEPSDLATTAKRCNWGSICWRAARNQKISPEPNDAFCCACRCRRCSRICSIEPWPVVYRMDC